MAPLGTETRHELFGGVRVTAPARTVLVEFNLCRSPLMTAILLQLCPEKWGTISPVQKVGVLFTVIFWSLNIGDFKIIR